MNSSGRIFIGLGTNLGNRIENLRLALDHLRLRGIKIVRTSPVFETKPWGFESSDQFFNAMAEVSADMSPTELLAVLKQVESEMGRKPRTGPAYESRIIDLDIIDFQGMCMHSEALELPHPQLQLRAFVLYPLKALEPKWVHPRLKKNMTELIEALDPQEIPIENPEKID